jgi:aminopeptidase N
MNPRKTILLLIQIVCFFNYTVLFSQSQDYWDKSNEIYSELKNDNLRSAIRMINRFLIEYPNDAGMYYNRGFANHMLNYVNASIADFQKAKSLGINDSILDFYISKEQAANFVAKAYSSYSEKLLLENKLKPNYTKADSLRGALRMERNCFDVNFYDLNVRVIPDEKKISGFNKIYFTAISPSDKIQLDLFQHYQIDSIVVEGHTLSYTREHNAVFVELENSLIVGKSYKLDVYYSGIPQEAIAPPWVGGFVWEKKKGKHWIGVACERLGASSWWPNKDHLSDKPDSMRITVEAPRDLTAIANGNLRKTTELNDGYNSSEWFVSYPINNYNVTLYIGDFVNFSEQFENENGVYDIDYYVLPHNLRKAKKFYKNTSDVIRVFEKLFGEYPYVKDGIAMVESPYEGMEHQSAIAIGGDYGKTKRRNYIETDYDYLVVHESAHEWWGNSVAIGDMADAWINEGFATYSEVLFLEEIYGYDSYISGIAEIMTNILNIWPIVGLPDVNDNTFVGGDIYSKGAVMLHNLRCSVDNDTLFKSFIKNYYQTFKNTISDTEDFLSFVSSELGSEYLPLLKTFLYKSDPPTLKYASVKEGADIILYYKFENVYPGFEMPINILTNRADKGTRLIATEKLQKVRLENTNIYFFPAGGEYRKTMHKNSFTYYHLERLNMKKHTNKYASGAVLEEGLLFDGLKEGVWKYYHQDGKLKESVHYSLGLKNGDYESYTSKGEKNFITQYVNDTIDGESYKYENAKLYSITSYSMGNMDTITYINEGVIESKGHLIEGKENGAWTIYHSNGKPASKGEFNRGEPVLDSWIFYDKEGHMLTSVDTLTTVSEAPKYRRGNAVFYEDVFSNLILDQSKLPDTNGTSYISFNISPQGTVEDIKVLKSFSEHFEEEISKTILKLPRWIPGYVNGKPVVTKMVYPFKYTLTK